jgi:hypothetical protein
LFPNPLLLQEYTGVSNFNKGVPKLQPLSVCGNFRFLSAKKKGSISTGNISGLYPKYSSYLLQLIMEYPPW